MLLQSLVQPAIQQRLQDLQGASKRHESHARFQQGHLKRAQETLETEEQSISDWQRVCQEEERKHRTATIASQSKITKMVEHARQQLV